VFCIDVEPDPRVFDPANPMPWTGFERILEWLGPLREHLSELTGRPAAFTWLLRMDPQVEQTWGSPTWVADAHEEVFSRLADAGDEFGLHTHTWRWDEATGDWIADYEDAAWGEHCLTMGLDAFERSFGRACTAHRGGDHLLNGEMLSVLVSRKVKVDLTVEPGLGPTSAFEGEKARGSSPDYRGVPAKPYRSSPGRFPARDPTASFGPLLIPLLSAPRRRPPFRREPLYVWDPPKGFRQRLAAQRLLGRPRVIAVVLRSDSGLYPGLWEMVTANLDTVGGYPEAAFVTATLASERYEAGTHVARAQT
jgi:hypothetical protein